MCYDMGWQHCSSGSTYNSISGHAFLVSASSNKILKQIVFSKSCCMCSRREKKDPEAAAKRAAEPMGILPMEGKDHRCPRNFKGSSKSMDLHDAVALLTDLFDSGIAFAAELLVDNDCSTKANTQHFFKAKIDVNIWANKETCWPRKTEVISLITASSPSKCWKSNIIWQIQCIDVKVLEGNSSSLLRRKKRS